MLAHRVLDALLKRDPQYNMMMAEGTALEHVQTLYAGIKTAVKFDFGDLPLEPAPEGGQHSFRVPDLTYEEKEWWVQGLIPLPFPICWYEYTLDGHWHGLLVSEELEADDETKRAYILMEVELVGDEFRTDGTVTGIDRKKVLPFASSWTFAIGGNNQNLTQKERYYGAALLHLSIYLTLMLNSKSTERELVLAPEKLNRRRQARGVTALPEFRRVRIVPWTVERVRGMCKGDRRAPRLHWRRSHKRHYEERTPHSRWMASETYKGRTGWWVTIIPRMWVSKAAADTVEQEYVVQGSSR